MNRVIAAVLLAGVALLGAGCIVVPHAHHGSHGRPYGGHYHHGYHGHYGHGGHGGGLHVHPR